MYSQINGVPKDLPHSQMKQPENEIHWNMAKGPKCYSEKDISEFSNWGVFVWFGEVTVSFSAWAQFKPQQTGKVREVRKGQRSRMGEMAQSFLVLL